MSVAIAPDVGSIDVVVYSNYEWEFLVQVIGVCLSKKW